MYKGYMHYHTGFHYSMDKKITPEKLAEDLKELNASFAFCAGDHGDIDGNNYCGLNVKEFKEYKEACLSVNKDSGVILIPSPEIHLMFSPFTERHEHHSYVPILDYLPKLEPPESQALAASYTKEISEFISGVHEYNLSLTLNHLYLSVNSLFNGPHPLTIPSLYNIDYLELYTIAHPDNFTYDFDLYLKFLTYAGSSMMACCAGVNNGITPFKLLSTEIRVIPSTYLYVSGTFTQESLMEAWNERRSYAVYGSLYLEEIMLIPSNRFIKEVEKPTIMLTVNSMYHKKIDKIEVYRNGIKLYEDGSGRKDYHKLIWEDRNPIKKENYYVVHIEGEGEHLITSPINYLFE